MDKRTYLRYAIAAAFALASGTSNLAFAVYESEPNQPITEAKPITISPEGTAEITGSIGAVTFDSSPSPDLDFFWFQAYEGNVLTFDIDGGMKPAGSGTRSVDTIIAVFGPLPDFTMLARMDQAADIDSGSLSRNDARIDNWRAPSTGKYVVGVSSFPRIFMGGGAVTNPSSFSGATANGSYTLLISGVRPLVTQINIVIKPGSDEYAPINPKAKGNIPVALLSSKEFDALKVKHDSLTFGRTGREYSYLRCAKEGSDVNGDNLLDLICHFDNEKAKFTRSTTEAKVKGKFVDSAGAQRDFEGNGLVRSVLPLDREED